jgi:hypothetical protein
MFSETLLDTKQLPFPKLMELVFDRPLPHPERAVARIYELSSHMLLQQVCNDEEQSEFRIVDLNGQSSWEFIYTRVIHDGLEALVSSQFIDRALGRFGIVAGPIRIEAYQLPGVETLCEFNTLTLSDEVLDQIHQRLMETANIRYPLTSRAQ